MFYVNHVIKPALNGQAGAWTSGGVEWNTGPQGHTVGCMQPVPVLILPREKDGSQSVAIGETERSYRTQWTVVVTLRPGRSFLEERIRLYNPTEYMRPCYLGNCTAVPNTPGFQFIYPLLWCRPLACRCSGAGVLARKPCSRDGCTPIPLVVQASGLWRLGQVGGDADPPMTGRDRVLASRLGRPGGG